MAVSALFHHVRSFIRQHRLIEPGARVVAAVSGGSDSVALAHLLAELDRSGDLHLAGIAHFNHQLRAAADDDERFVAGLAREIGRPLVADRGDVAARAAHEGRSLEDAARAARYEFFERARRELDADLVALGHTRDDQAETFLLRLLRGAGPRGLSGMHARNGMIVRPLLDCRRADLRPWIDERDLAHVEDESNHDLRIPRNRVRAELLPLLVERFNPAVVDALASEAELLQEQWAWMAAEADAYLARERRGSPGSNDGTLDVAALRRAPAALRRLVIWRALTDASGGRQISADHVASVIRLIHADGGSVDVPGQRVQRIGSSVVLQRREDSKGSANLANPVNLANLFWYPLSIPGEVQIPEAGCVVTVEYSAVSCGGGEGRATTGSGATAVVRRDLVRGSLAVRNRRPGDRFRPVGLGGSKKLQDLFVDRKVARLDRDTVPLVVDSVDGSDRIVWVAGFGIDEAFRVTDAAQAVLLFRLTHLKGFRGGSA